MAENVKRRWHMKLDVEGDSLEDVLCLAHRYLRQAETRLSEESGAGTVDSCVTGGYSASGVYEVNHEPEMTHDRYFELQSRELATDTRAPAAPPLVTLAERAQALASIMAVVDEMPSKEILDAGYEEALAIAEALHAMGEP